MTTDSGDANSIVRRAGKGYGGVRANGKERPKAAVIRRSDRRRGSISVYMGLDVGTTSVSCVAIDPEAGRIHWSRSIPHKADLGSEADDEHRQDPDRLLDRAR